MWQFNYSSFCRFILEETKRISLGEYVDKAEIGNKIRKIFGLKEEADDDKVTEKTGN